MVGGGEAKTGGHWNQGGFQMRTLCDVLPSQFLQVHSKLHPRLLG